MLFVPTGSPSPDFYGGERKGDNTMPIRWSRCALPRKVVHFQVVTYGITTSHHSPCSSKSSEAAEASRPWRWGQRWATSRPPDGQAIVSVEERKVPQSDVPGEESSPTQPFPVRPRPLAPYTLAPEEAWGITPDDRQWCSERIKSLRSEGIFALSQRLGSISRQRGRHELGSMAFDPRRGLVIASTNRIATVVKLIPREEANRLRSTGEANRMKGEFGRQTGTPYVMYRELLRAPSGAPCNQPPWGALAAVDLSSGDVRWEVPLGAIPQLSLFPKSTEWGSINLGGAIVTAGGLVFIAAAMDTYLRAFDIETGKQMWSGQLPASGQATPMTYRAGNKQYVIIAAGGHGKLGTKTGDSVVAFSLP